MKQGWLFILAMLSLSAQGLVGTYVFRNHADVNAVICVYFFTLAGILTVLAIYVTHKD